MAIPKAVRQRMINVMYIVLLALLALQIPKEVTQAFIKIDKGIIASNSSIDLINETNIMGLEKKGEKDEDAAKFASLTRLVQDESNELCDYIDEIKHWMMVGIGTDEETGDIEYPEEVHMTSEILVHGGYKWNPTGGDDGTGDLEKQPDDGVENGEAKELKIKIDEVRLAMLELIPQDDLEEGQFESIEDALTLSTAPAKEGGDWMLETFDHMPAAGAMAMLSQIQADAKTSESKIIDELSKLVGLDRVEFDQFNARIVAPTSYVLRGDVFTAELFLSASSSDNSNMTIRANGATLKPDNQGVAKFEVRTTRVGEFPIAGEIVVTNKKGEKEPFKFPPFTYTVADPFASVNPTKMNVFYIGVDNPVSVSAAGVVAKDIRTSMTGGDISGANGTYVVRVNQQGTAEVSVRDASGKQHGKFDFRVKRIPDPVAKVANKPGGNITAGELKVQKGIAAILEGFDFDAKFKVVSFDMVYAAKRQDLAVARGNGASFNAQMSGYLGRAKPGDLYYFENVKVRGPDGQTRPIPGITFRVR